jgi:hypothetical protein
MYEYLEFLSACENNQFNLIDTKLRHFIFSLNLPLETFKLILHDLFPLLQGKVFRL